MATTRHRVTWTLSARIMGMRRTSSSPTWRARPRSCRSLVPRAIPRRSPSIAASCAGVRLSRWRRGRYAGGRVLCRLRERNRCARSSEGGPRRACGRCDPRAYRSAHGHSSSGGGRVRRDRRPPGGADRGRHPRPPGRARSRLPVGRNGRVRAALAGRARLPGSALSTYARAQGRERSARPLAAPRPGHHPCCGHRPPSSRTGWPWIQA